MKIAFTSRNDPDDRPKSKLISRISALTMIGLVRGAPSAFEDERQAIQSKVASNLRLNLGLVASAITVWALATRPPTVMRLGSELTRGRT
jgi:hypothetical protein